MPAVRVFRYVETLDAFVVAEEFQRLADYLGLSEWSAVVWIGRLFTLDEDYGEHWFDNWDEREAQADRAEAEGIHPEDLLIVVPDRFAAGGDGPCHPPEIRKRFWTDVLKSLELSYELLFEEARLNNSRARTLEPDAYIADLEERISEIQSGRFQARLGEVD